ncbi:hypothetical protein [Rugamonas sp.]|uniref:hypothetical protein n=1 Tax=Rugamonas sp. TaxID=1926287 RepID=UPI0025E87928|nr:hypothetical protein [Rugamonas sp.]
MQDKVRAVMRCGTSKSEATGFFRVALGLCYLASLMTKETLDFKHIDRDYNRFIYRTLGKGHSITSILQFMSGEKVVDVIAAPRFTAAFALHCPEVPVDTIPFLLGLNLGVAKDISKIDVRGPVADWIERQRLLREEADGNGG